MSSSLPKTQSSLKKVEFSGHKYACGCPILPITIYSATEEGCHESFRKLTEFTCGAHNVTLQKAIPSCRADKPPNLENHPWYASRDVAYRNRTKLANRRRESLKAKDDKDTLQETKLVCKECQWVGYKSELEEYGCPTCGEVHELIYADIYYG